MITVETIMVLAPKARVEYVDALISGGDTLEKYGINTQMRFAQFLANCCQETGGLTIVRENMNYSAARIKQVWPTRPEAVKFAGKPRELANSVYGGRMGNRPGTDDGWNFRGIGFLQTTGRDNYERIGKELGLPLGEQPELLEDAATSLRAAAAEFAPFAKLCDRGDAGFRAVCNGINRGNIAASKNPTGWSDRLVWLRRVTDAMAIAVVVDDTIEIGDSGPLVRAFQERLNTLGYHVGKADGIYGPRTRGAVATFQIENHLSSSGIIGPETRRALNSDNAIAMPVGERATETAKDLREQGSSIIINAQAIKSSAQAGAALAGLAGVGQQVQSSPTPAAIDPIAISKDVVTEVGTWKSIITGLGDGFQFLTSHWWIFGIAAAFAFYRWGSLIEIKRVQAHQSGANLDK